MTVEEIFNKAKSIFVYKTDQENYGTPEFWASIAQLRRNVALTGTLTDDCDGFATYVVGELRSKGKQARYVFCLTETGEGHLVAECEGQILDNRQDYLSKKSLLPYTWLTISGYAPGEPWHKLV